MSKTEEITVEEYLAEILDGADDVPEADREALKKTLAHEKLWGKVKGGYLRKSDYSRAHDKLRETEKEQKEWFKAKEAWVAEQAAADHNNKEAWDKLQAELVRLKGSKPEDPDDDATPRETQKYEEKLAKWEERLTNFEKDIGKKEKDLLQVNALQSTLVLKHFKEFGEILDTAKLLTFCGENNLDLLRGYEEFTKDIRREIAEKARKDELDKAREEGRQEERSKKIPTPDKSRFTRKVEQPLSREEAKSKFIEGIRKIRNFVQED